MDVVVTGEESSKFIKAVMSSLWRQKALHTLTKRECPSGSEQSQHRVWPTWFHWVTTWHIFFCFVLAQQSSSRHSVSNSNRVGQALCIDGYGSEQIKQCKTKNFQVHGAFRGNIVSGLHSPKVLHRWSFQQE